MNDQAYSSSLFPMPRARRVAANAISVMTVLPINLLLTDDEAAALIEQLQVARAMPAPAIEAEVPA
jgi:hypothetical protein